MNKRARNCMGHVAHVLLIALVVSAAKGHGQVVSADIVSAVDSLHAALVAETEKDDAVSANAKSVDRFVAGVLKRHPQIDDVLRVNSKGKVQSEAARDGKLGKKFRSVADQGWFKKAGPGQEEYYGTVKTRKGEYLLFWALPVSLSGPGGTKRSAGALVCKIQLDKVLAAAGGESTHPYKVVFEKSTVYNRGWKGASGEQTTFDIKGMEGLVLWSVARKKPVAPSAAGSSPSGDSQWVDVGPGEAASEGASATTAVAPSPSPTTPATPASVAPAPDTASPKAASTPARSKGGGAGMWLLLLIVALAGGAGFVLWRQISQYRAQKDRRVMDEVEGASEEYEEEDEEEVADQTGAYDSGVNVEAHSPGARPGAVSPPSRPALAQVPLSQIAAVTRRIPMPDPFAPQGPAPMQAQGPRPASPPSSAQQPISVAEYEKLRQHLRTEIARELSAQIGKDTSKLLEAYGGEITMVLHQLIGKISELGDNPTRLTEVVGASIHELNAVVNKYRQQVK